MKSLQILAASVLAAAAVGTASAQVVAGATEIHITGSTSYRAPVIKAIQDVLNVTSYAWDGSDGANVYGSSAAIFAGTLKSDSTKSLIIKTDWCGSLSGLISLSTANINERWIDDSVIRTNAALTSGYAIENHAPEIALSDVFSDSGAKSVATAPGNGTTYSNAINSASLVNAGSLGTGRAGTVKTVGIVPFQWVAGIQTSGVAPFINMSQQAAASLISGGNVPVVALNGNTASKYDFAFLVGRNEDSGSRITAFAEAQYGFGKSPFQYQIAFNNNQTAQSDNLPTGGVRGAAYATVKSLDLWPANAPMNVLPSINWAGEGHSGYLSNTDMCNVLSAANPLTGLTFNLSGAGEPGGFDANGVGTTKSYLVGYLGILDARRIANSNIAGASRVELTYGGVAYSPANVYNGTYTCWSFEHMYYRMSGSNAITTAGTAAKIFADQLADQIFAFDAQTTISGGTVGGVPPANSAVGGLLFNNAVLFTRTREGTPLLPNY